MQICKNSPVAHAHVLTTATKMRPGETFADNINARQTRCVDGRGKAVTFAVIQRHPRVDREDIDKTNEPGESDSRHVTLLVLLDTVVSR